MAEGLITTPLGLLRLKTQADAIVSGEWLSAETRDDGQQARDDPLLILATAAIEDYFAGRRQTFDLPFAPHGTPFQRRVWRLVAAIPYGHFETYGVLARHLGNVAAQAVGQACARNPIPLFIPCHRVLAAGGRLGGYSGAENKKKWLLNHEGLMLPP